jgi:VanZ family protein
MLKPTLLQSLFRLAFVASVLVIATIAFLPNYDDLPELTSFSDILNHFAAFFVLSLFLERGFSPRVQVAFMLLFAYGLFIETVQHFLPSRCFDLLDLAVDMAGVAAYYLLLYALFLVKRSKL